MDRARLVVAGLRCAGHGRHRHREAPDHVDRHPEGTWPDAASAYSWCLVPRGPPRIVRADELLEAELIGHVVVLARSDIADAMRARDLGTFVRLDKPDTSDRLLAAVERDDRG